MSEPTHFIVFKRTGGSEPMIVDAIASSTRADADARFKQAAECRFEVLLITADWDAARERIVVARVIEGLPDMPVSTWGEYRQDCDTCSRDEHHCSLCETIVGHGHFHDDVIEPLDADADLATVR